MTERLEGYDGRASLDYNNYLDESLMDDMPTKGFWFTWSNKRGGNEANKSRLDRVDVNADWASNFPESEAWVLAPSISDRSPVLVIVMA